MAQDGVILQFSFTTFGDSMLQKMDALRRDRRFCDVIVRINDLKIPGHKVVLAAGSPFLRDQFFLQGSHEVEITTQQDAEVGKRLLLSCYTGTLEFPELELVHYLTVASFLQMGHIVEQCTQALNKFIKPSKSDDLHHNQPSNVKESQEEPLIQTVFGDDDDGENVIDDDNDDDDDDDDDVIIEPRSSPVYQNTQHKSPGEETSISIIKVESMEERLQEVSQNLQNPSNSPALRSPEPQHSLINSTVEMRPTEVAPNTPLDYTFSSPSTSGATKEHVWNFFRGAEKGMQWYHQCPKCARVFRQLENYANHLKMHKLFMCLLCGKTFTQKGNLHRHMRVHAGIKPFQCKICGKTFTQKCSLLDHLNLHSGDKPHRCNYCEMVFAHKPVLRKHLKQIHGKNSFDNANEGNLIEAL